MVFAPIALKGMPRLGPGLTLERAWVVKSKGDGFGGYSALVSLGGGGLLALSDFGRYLRFSDPSRGDPQPRMGWFLNKEETDKRRVDSESLDRQLTLAGCNARRSLPFHRMLLDGELPLTIGGGIGQSRMCMLLLGKAHIGEVQSSIWDAATRSRCHEAGVTLL